MNLVYPIFYSCVAVVAVVRAIRMAVSLKTNSAKSNIDIFSIIDTVPKYYVGVKISVVDAITKRRSVFYYIWTETAVSTETGCKMLMAYCKRQIPSLGDRMVIRKLSVVKHHTEPDVLIGPMVGTPHITHTQKTMLIILSSILTAGKIIRENNLRTPTWNHY